MSVEMWGVCRVVRMLATKTSFPGRHTWTKRLPLSSSASPFLLFPSIHPCSFLTFHSLHFTSLPCSFVAFPSSPWPWLPVPFLLPYFLHLFSAAVAASLATAASWLAVLATSPASQAEVTLPVAAAASPAAVAVIVDLVASWAAAPSQQLH